MDEATKSHKKTLKELGIECRETRVLHIVSLKERLFFAQCPYCSRTHGHQALAEELDEGFMGCRLADCGLGEYYGYVEEIYQ